MKKIFGAVIFVLGVFAGNAFAQETETKAKSVATPKDKVHNIFHPRHKRHSAYKYKHTSGDHKRKVYARPNKVEIKNQ
jgi:hypothetical protein